MPMNSTFMLVDTLYVKANIPPTDTVCLWLGVCYNILFLFNNEA